MKNVYLSALVGFLVIGCSPKMILSGVDTSKIPTKKDMLSQDALKNWSHLDLEADTIPGMSIDRAYKTLLKDLKGQKIIVGVIDSGVDIEHTDLRTHIWINQDEIPNNQIDDDKNQYADDMHGWNFLGDILHENLEFVRIMREADKTSEAYQKAEEKYESKFAEAEENKTQVEFIKKVDEGLKTHLGKKEYTLEDVEGITTDDFMLGQYKAIMQNILTKSSKEAFNKEIKSYEEYVSSQLDYHLNIDFEGRKKLGDNPNDIKQNVYGNNDVIGPDKEEAKHGTHVSGIIVKSFGKEGNANAENIQIMAIRAVPDGDEYDKDIALAIRYAADNGAKVINTSFGKEFSPHKDWVFDAITYAASKDVLIVNAAGNDAYDIDKVKVYPNDTDSANSPEIADNFLTVGALNFEFGKELLANFSNYGKQNVDVFAPGVKIYATTPNNTYEFLSGTSMAAPNVSGVAALIRSYYPQLTASEVKHILMDSGITIQSKVVVGEEELGLEIPFSETCKSGKIVNAYNALLMAKNKASKK